MLDGGSGDYIHDCMGNLSLAIIINSYGETRRRKMLDFLNPKDAPPKKVQIEFITDGSPVYVSSYKAEPPR